MEQKPVHGIIPAVATVFKHYGPGHVVGSDYAIDWQRQWRLVDELMQTPIDGLLFAGTTGQDTVMTHRQQALFVQACYEHVKSKGFKGLIMAGAGSNNTEEALDLDAAISKISPEIVRLHVTGYKNNPPQGGIYRHFKALNDNATGAGIVLYNIPGRTGSDIAPETVIALSKLENIKGIKWAKPNTLDNVTKIIAETSEDFAVLCGNDDEYYQMICRGASGAIAATGSVAPRLFTRIRDEFSIEPERAKNQQDYANPFIAAIFGIGLKSPSAINYMLAADVPNAGLKPPLFSIAQENEIHDEKTGFNEDYSKQRKSIATGMRDYYSFLLPMAQEMFKKYISIELQKGLSLDG